MPDHQTLHELRGFDDVTRLLSGEHPKGSDTGTGPAENRTAAHSSAATDTDSSEEFEPKCAFQ